MIHLAGSVFASFWQLLLQNASDFVALGASAVRRKADKTFGRRPNVKMLQVSPLPPRAHNFILLCSFSLSDSFLKKISFSFNIFCVFSCFFARGMKLHRLLQSLYRILSQKDFSLGTKLFPLLFRCNLLTACVTQCVSI